MDYKKFAEHFIANNAFARHIGLVVTDVGEGFAKGELLMREEFSNFSNTLHGAIYYALADTLTGIASKTYGYSSVTLEGKMNFIKAVKEGKIYGEARVLSQGKSTGVYETKVYDKDERLLAVATYTFYTLDRKIELAE